MPKQAPKIRWVIWFLGSLFYFYELMIRVSPSVMVDELIVTFQVDAALLGSLSAFYFYAYAAMQMPAGLLMDRFGARKLLTASILFCGLGNIVFAISPTLGVAEIGRLFTGIGSSFAFVGLVYICSHWFHPRHLASLIGLGSSIGMLGSFAGEGPLAIGVEHFGWRFPSLILGLIGIVFALIFFLTLRKTASIKKKRKTNTLQKLWQNLKLVVSRIQSWINAFIGSFLFVTTSAFAGLWAPSFLQVAHRFSREKAGFAASMVFIGWIIGSPITGHLSDRLKKRRPVLQGGILLTFLCLLPLVYLPTLSHSLIFALLLCIGIFSSAQNLCFSVSVELHPRFAKGTAIAFTNALIALFGAIFQPLVGFLLDLAWGENPDKIVPVYTPQDYLFALTAFPITLLVAFLFTLFLREKGIRAQNNLV